MDEVLEQLEDYFNNSKQECWFGIQNFQGVREYTKIPLAPLTLVYGQNSAGKSTIHDAQQFISVFLVKILIVKQQQSIWIAGLIIIGIPNR